MKRLLLLTQSENIVGDSFRENLQRFMEGLQCKVDMPLLESSHIYSSSLPPT
jgi:hypothetical protein